MAAVSNKRKRSVLTLETKLEIVRALEKGNAQREFASKFGVAKSTVADNWKDRQKLSNFTLASESCSYTKKRCIIRDPKFDLVDDACWNWFYQQRAKGAY